jgi:hypothetical protein
MGPVSRFAQRVVLCAGTLTLFGATICAQDAPSGLASSAPQQFGVIDDWSTQRVIYTHNGSLEDMMKVRNDPRFLNSFLLHSMREQAHQAALAANGQMFGQQLLNEQSLDEPGSETSEQDQQVSEALGPTNTHFGKTKVDWAVDLGPTFGMAIGESPAKYAFNPSGKPTCTVGTTPGDFVVFSLKAPPKVGTQGNLVALTNLYSGTAPTGFCGTAPTFLFSYAIGSGGSLLSPVLSLNGSKVGWIENNSAGHAILHVTTWVLGQGTNATTGAVAVGNCSSGASCDVAIDYTSSAYPGCTATPSINTNSEIYVDYSGDNAFIGADNGILYHVKTFFTGTPTVDFCIVVNNTAGTALSGGVYDSLLSPPELFIADSKKLYAYTVGASAFTLKTSVTYGNGTLTGPGPVLDAFNNFIYVFSAQDTGTPNHTSVTQLPTTLASSVVVPLGPASTNAYPILFYGAFDNNYLNFGPKNAASTLYSCGADATTTTAQDLYAVSFVVATGLANTTPAMSANKNVNPGGANGTCSPITEFFDGTTDRLFIGMGEHSATTGANVVTSWNVTTRPLATTAATHSATGYIGGSSGIVIDNNANLVTFPQAASIYFTTLVTSATATTCGANRYCAVKLTQGALN